jgi:hypothetical protein
VPQCSQTCIESGGIRLQAVTLTAVSRVSWRIHEKCRSSDVAVAHFGDFGTNLTVGHVQPFFLCLCDYRVVRRPLDRSRYWQETRVTRVSGTSRRRWSRMGSLGEGWKRPGDPDDADPEPEGNRIAIASKRERSRPADGRRAKLAWVLGWPPLFIAAFVVSTQLHDSSAEVPGTFSLDLSAGVTTGEFVAFLVGVAGVIIWIVGCLVLLFRDS